VTKQQFLEKYKHELYGVLFDALRNPRSGPEGSRWYDAMCQRIDARLGEIFDSLTKQPEAIAPKPAPPPPPHANGVHKPATPPAQPPRR